MILALMMMLSAQSLSTERLQTYVAESQAAGERWIDCAVASATRYGAKRISAGDAADAAMADCIDQADSAEAALQTFLERTGNTPKWSREQARTSVVDQNAKMRLLLVRQIVQERAQRR